MKNQFTGIYKFDEFDAAFIGKMVSVCNSISQAGFDPYSQLMGYLLTGEDYYITRTGDPGLSLSLWIRYKSRLM